MADPRHQYENYRFCYDNGHEQWVQQAAQNFNFWRGRQWDAQVKAKLERSGRPALTFNVIESLVRSMKGIQRALRNDVRFTPVHSSTIEQARVHDAIWLHTQNQNSFDFLETDVYEKGLIMGRAYYEMRLAYDDNLQGHIVIKQRRSQDVVLDPSVETYETCDWPQVFTRRWVSYQDLVRMFGREKANVVGRNAMPSWYDYEDQFMAQQMGDMPYYHADALEDTTRVRAHLLLSRQYQMFKRKDVFVDVETGDTKEIPESWDHNRISLALRTFANLNVINREVRCVRWCVTCENEVMHDEESPYRRFTIIPFFPTFVDGVTMGAVDSLIDPQQLFNKVTSQELHIINTTANSGWISKKGNVKNLTPEEMEQVGAKTGIYIEVDDISQIEKITPNQTPQGHDRLSFKADQIMRNLSGVSNQGRGFAREDVAGEAIMANQAAQEINFAGWLSNLHRSKQMVASFAQEMVQAHYTETRVIQINRGTALAPQMESITINQPSAEGQMLNDVTEGRFTTTLVPAPSRATMSEEDFALLIKLRTELGIAIPDAMMIELSPAANKAQLIQMLNGDSNERQRAIEEAQQREAEANAGLAEAKRQKEESAADLNSARARKFEVETQTDPDAAYERVEYERIQAERDEADRRFALEQDKFVHQVDQDQKDLAIRLAELDAKREADAQRAKAAAQKPKPAPKKA